MVSTGARGRDLLDSDAGQSPSLEGAEEGWVPVAGGSDSGFYNSDPSVNIVPGELLY